MSVDARAANDYLDAFRGTKGPQPPIQYQGDEEIRHWLELESPFSEKHDTLSQLPRVELVKMVGKTADWAGHLEQQPSLFD